MIDFERESLLTLKEARKLPVLRRNGKQPDLATLYRWSMPNGCRGVRLDTAQVGGVRMTSKEAVLRFIGELTRRARGDAESYPTTVQRERDHHAAEQELAGAGF